MGTPLVPSIDSETKQLPDAVRARLADNLRDPKAPEGTALESRYPAVESDHRINVCRYGATGTGGDDTAAIKAALGDCRPGSVLVFPGRTGLGAHATYGTSETIVVPNQVRVEGGNQNAGTVVRALSTGITVMSVGSASVVEDIQIDGAGLARFGIYTRYGSNKPSFWRVRVVGCTSAGYALDGLQNTAFYDCFAQYNEVNYWIANGCANLKFYNCNGNLDDTQGQTSTSRNIKVSNEPASSGFVGTVFQAGNRNIDFFGGIFERGPGDYNIELLNAAGPFALTGVELNNGTIAMIRVGPSFGQEVHLVRVAYSSNGTNLALKAESGRVVRYEKGSFSGLNNRDPESLFSLSGSASMALALSTDSERPNLLTGNSSNFSADVGAWVGFGGGSAVKDGTGYRLLFTSSGPSTGARFGGVARLTDSTGRSILRARFFVTGLTAADGSTPALNFGTVLAVSPFRRVISPVTLGWNDITLPLQGDEYGVYLAAANTATVVSGAIASGAKLQTF